jgi:ADP-ribose pyrophosphatase YjhB (NUDIX family)
MSMMTIVMNKIVKHLQRVVRGRKALSLRSCLATNWQGLWTLPGEEFKQNESLECAFKREIRERTWSQAISMSARDH